MALTFNIMENDALRPLFLEAIREAVVEAELRADAKVLLRLLSKRFGELAVWVREKVNAADGDTLSLWIDRVLDARSLEDVIGPRPNE